MWNIKCQLPPDFSERANSIFARLDEYELDDRATERRLALGKALRESCRLLRDLNIGVFAEDIVQVLREGRRPIQWQAPPAEFYKFLEAEAAVLRDMRLSHLASARIQQLILEAQRLDSGSVRPGRDVVEGLRELEGMICRAAADRVRLSNVRRIGKRVGWGIGGVSLASANMFAAIPASVGAAVDMIWHAVD